MIEQVLWASSHHILSQISDAGLHPLATTGCTSGLVGAGPTGYWQQRAAALCSDHGLRLWCNLEATTPAEAARLVDWWERESGAGAYVRGYLIDDEPQFTGPGQFAAPADVVARIRAVRPKTPKPLWLNLIGNATARPYFQLGGHLADYPDIYTFAVYPWMGADNCDKPSDRYLMDLGQARGQVQQLLNFYAEAPAGLTPKAGKVCGVIAQCASWEFQCREDRMRPEIVAHGAMTEAKMRQMARLALGRRDPSQGDSWSPLAGNVRDGLPVLAFMAWYGWIDESRGRRGVGESAALREALKRTTAYVAAWDIASPYPPAGFVPPVPEPPPETSEMVVKVPKGIKRITLEVER